MVDLPFIYAPLYAFGHIIGLFCFSAGIRLESDLFYSLKLYKHELISV